MRPMAQPRTVLIVDDERTIADVVARYLEREGYRAVVARDGEEAIAVAERERPDVVVLDVMLPKLDGLQVMAMLRRKRPTPVILLTARGEESERVSGLKLGADDYVVKPFSPAELVARVGAVLRRQAVAGRDDGELLSFGDIIIDPAARTLLGARRAGRADGEGVRAAAAPGAQPGPGILARRPDGRRLALPVLLEHGDGDRARAATAAQDRGGPAQSRGIW